jgi:hypothetical protein
MVMPEPEDKELDQILQQIFQGAPSLPSDVALQRALELEEAQTLDPLSVLISTIGRIMLRLDRIETALNKVEQHLATQTSTLSSSEATTTASPPRG